MKETYIKQLVNYIAEGDTEKITTYADLIAYDLDLTDAEKITLLQVCNAALENIFFGEEVMK